MSHEDKILRLPQVNLSERQRDLLREFDSLEAGRNNNPRAQSFMDKLYCIMKPLFNL